MLLDQFTSYTSAHEIQALFLKVTKQTTPLLFLCVSISLLAFLVAGMGHLLPGLSPRRIALASSL